MIDVAAVERFRREAGLAVRALAGVAGLPQARLRGLFDGTNHHTVTLDMLARLAGALGVHPASLLAGGTDYVAAARPDDVRLEAALALAGKRMNRSALCRALGWKLTRLDRAQQALAERLKGSALQVQTQGGLALRVRPDALDGETAAAVTRKALPPRGVSVSATQLIRLVADRAIAVEAVDADRKLRKVLADLQRLGYADVVDGELVLSSALHRALAAAGVEPHVAPSASTSVRGAVARYADEYVRGRGDEPITGSRRRWARVAPGRNGFEGLVDPD